MTAARLAAQCVELLGPLDGPVEVRAPAPLAQALAALLPSDRTGDAVAAVCDFRDEPSEHTPWGSRLAPLATRLPPGSVLVVVDHNQPRGWWQRVVGTIVLAARGVPPMRARYPTAREIAAQGFVVERLRLCDGERIQLVRASRRRT